MSRKAKAIKKSNAIIANATREHNASFDAGRVAGLPEAKRTFDSCRTRQNHKQARTRTGFKFVDGVRQPVDTIGERIRVVGASKQDKTAGTGGFMFLREMKAAIAGVEPKRPAPRPRKGNTKDTITGVQRETAQANRDQLRASRAWCATTGKQAFKPNS